MIRKVTHQLHSHNETAKSLAMARGTAAEPPKKRLVPSVSKSNEENFNHVNSRNNDFDGFSGDNEF
jgi:hypothetical protein